jgi:hypothetical protein
VLLHHHLPGGVRLRLPHRTDADGLRDLGCTPDPLLHFDPRRRAVIVAASLETVVGVGAIELRRGATPDLLVARDDAVREHLRAALLARVARHPRRSRDHGVRRALVRGARRLAR